MKKAVYAGSFDPITIGHLNVISRAAKLFDTLYVTVLINSQKKPAFSFEERKEMIETALEEAGIKNVVVESSSGLLAEYAKSVGANYIVRGIRGASDLESEFAQEQGNKHLNKDIEVLYFSAEPSMRHISSSMVREIASYNGNIKGFVPDTIKTKIEERLKKL